MSLTDERIREMFYAWFDPDDNGNYWYCFLDAYRMAEAEAMKPQEPIGYDDIFNAIAEAASPCGEGIVVSVKAFKRVIGGEIFLSPTIPEGMALVPIEPTQEMCEQAYYEFNAEQKDFDAANLYRAMIQAAGVTK